MSQSSAMNSSGSTEEKHGGQDSFVKLEVTVKEEPLECTVCGVKTRECLDMFTTRTPSGASLLHFIAKYTQVDLAFTDSCSKQSCKSCYDLINVLERTELEYVKLKETFEAILSKNPLFELSVVPAPIGLSAVKRELDAPEDSEDEPLARRKANRHTKTVKKKKKVTGKLKRKKSIERNSWECEECGAVGEDGGHVALAAHKITVHTVIAPVKIEDGSQSPFNNGNDDLLEVTFEHFDDDDDEDSNFNPDEFNDSNNVNKKKAKKMPTERKKPKVMHPCDQCSSRYSSLARLEAHKVKHDGSKPPYICEVCGAHYKHKRACDIHIALHKGISDWKCEECNKLFPSKNALQRHNNIHTGKLNYQCDLCGKSFIHTSSFKMHKLSHSGVKPHSCRVCGLALMTRSHLKRHERIHSGEKRHECTACGKRFSERYNLAAHMKSHESAATPPPVDRRRPMFRCQFCTERFERRYMLERHMSTVHGRTLERPPPTPRNTMSKLLKQRAQRPPTQDPPQDNKSSPEPARTPPVPNSAPLPSSKLLAQLTSSASIITTGSWSGAYAAEFGLRHEYPH